jgi:hypothetical protein
VSARRERIRERRERIRERIREAILADERMEHEAGQLVF